MTPSQREKARKAAYRAVEMLIQCELGGPSDWTSQPEVKAELERIRDAMRRAGEA